MPREVTHLLLPLQIAGAGVVMLTLAWPVLGLRERPPVGDQATAPVKTQDRTEVGNDDERPTIRKAPHPDPR